MGSVLKDTAAWYCPPMLSKIYRNYPNLSTYRFIASKGDITAEPYLNRQY